jgi:hypothetical protein
MAAKRPSRLTAAQERDLYELVLQLLADVQALRTEVAIVKARVSVRPPKA